MTDTIQDLSIDLYHVLECVTDIRGHDLRTYFTLSRMPGSTVAELANALERDRSSINRSLTTLFESGMVDRERRLMEGGGYVYQYYAQSIQETKNQLHHAIDQWSVSAHATVDSFDIEGNDR